MVTEHRGRLMKKSIWGGRNKSRIEDSRMSHPIAPKGHQNQEDKENVRKGYRIVLAYGNSKERSFDSNATYTDRQTEKFDFRSWVILCTDRFLLSSSSPPCCFLRSSGRSLLSFRSVCFCYWLLHLESFQMRTASSDL